MVCPAGETIHRGCCRSTLRRLTECTGPAGERSGSDADDEAGGSASGCEPRDQIARTPRSDTNCLGARLLVVEPLQTPAAVAKLNIDCHSRRRVGARDLAVVHRYLAGSRHDSSFRYERHPPAPPASANRVKYLLRLRQTTAPLPHPQRRRHGFSRARPRSSAPALPTYAMGLARPTRRRRRQPGRSSPQGLLFARLAL
jgi:hypothetical protein